MKVLKIYPTSINQRFIDEAAEAMRQGNTVIAPTDSVYALMADALNNRAIENLCDLKELTPRKDLLSVICADLSMASEYALIDNRAYRCIRRYTPGPITFILPASSHLPKAFRGRRTVGLRIPDCAVATQLTAALGGPVLTTSVGLDPAEGCSPDDVGLAYATRVPLMLDSGHTPGILTTVVDLTDSTAPAVVRPGAIDFEP